MKIRYGHILIVAAAVIILGSCAAAPDVRENEIAKDLPDTHTQAKDSSEYLKISTPYTLKSLLVPVIQMNDFIMSIDYFDQFIEYGDYIFPDYLSRILGMEAESYLDGQGTVLFSENAGSDFPLSFEKALLSSNKEGNRWWQFRMDYNGRELILEVLVNKYTIPQKIRYIDSETGFKHELIPDIAYDFERALTEVPPDQLTASIEGRISQNIREGFEYLFTNVRIIEEETITTPAGTFRTVHVRDELTGTDWVDYWLSPDVPGGIVKTAYTLNGEPDKYMTELIVLDNSIDSMIKSNDLIPVNNKQYNDDLQRNMEPGISEGSPGAAILLYPEESYYGSVGDGGISYYKFTTTSRCDILIEVEGKSGNAELQYFGSDSKFDSWENASEGDVLTADESMLEKGSTVYFTVNDIIDEYSVGEHYVINVHQNAILNPVGIMKKGDIYTHAQELRSGKDYVLTAGAEGLDYYKTTIRNGSTLQIKVTSEPAFGKLIWFDTEKGSYSSIYDEENPKGHTISVNGLSKGTVCYYYFSSDISLLDPLEKLKLTISEY